MEVILEAETAEEVSALLKRPFRSFPLSQRLKLWPFGVQAGPSSHRTVGTGRPSPDTSFSVCPASCSPHAAFSLHGRRGASGREGEATSRRRDTSLWPERNQVRGHQWPIMSITCGNQKPPMLGPGCFCVSGAWCHVMRSSTTLRSTKHRPSCRLATAALWSRKRLGPSRIFLGALHRA